MMDEMRKGEEVGGVGRVGGGGGRSKGGLEEEVGGVREGWGRRWEELEVSRIKKRIEEHMARSSHVRACHELVQE